MADGAITLWGAGELLGDFFGRSTEWPSSFYMALVCNNAPGPFTDGVELDEPQGGDYARVEIPNSTDSWEIDEESISNSTDIVFPVASDYWGNIRYWALCNDTTEGQLYFYGDFTESVTSDVDDQVIISAGTLNIIVGPIFTGVDDGS
jgi:hypothetical protein